MNPTNQFFTKLRKLAVTLESETDKLQQAFDNRNSEDDSETTARAMRAYHEMNCEVLNLKGQIQGQLTKQKAWVNEVTDFINTTTEMGKKVTEDIQELMRHCEKYGYKAPQKPNETKSQESQAEVDEAETKSAEAEERLEKAEGLDSSSPLASGPLPSTDLLRTPQLSDFGLSEMQLKRVLAGADWCSEVPPMPEMNLPHPSLDTPAPPPMPITPKCALRMDDDELQTPQMHDFGISEHTVCLNNDFTMDLFRKNVDKPQKPSQDIPPVNSLIESLKGKDELESPQLPVFCTPGFKIKKTNSLSTRQASENGEPASPGSPANLPTTPEVPAFQTPYMNRLVSTKKSARQTESIKVQDDDFKPTFDLPTPPHNGATASKRTWEYDVPELSLIGVGDQQMPEMPNLESVLGNSLQGKTAKIPKKTSEFQKVTKDPTVNSLDLDGPTQEFSLGTPRIRMDYQEPSTPEMPDLSSVTQDICKLVSQAQLKKMSMAVVHPNVRPEKERNRTMYISVVSESEFQSLPSYMKQMTLHNLNQAVHNINKYTEENQGIMTMLKMEELKKITNVGTKTPVYVICLTELKRLKRVEEANNTSLYKVCTDN